MLRKVSYGVMKHIFEEYSGKVGMVPLGVQDIHKVVPETQIIQVVDFMQP